MFKRLNKLNQPQGNFSKFHDFNADDKELIRKWSNKEVKTSVLVERFGVGRTTLYNYAQMLIDNGEMSENENIRKRK